MTLMLQYKNTATSDTFTVFKQRTYFASLNKLINYNKVDKYELLKNCKTTVNFYDDKIYSYENLKKDLFLFDFENFSKYDEKDNIIELDSENLHDYLEMIKILTSQKNCSDKILHTNFYFMKFRDYIKRKYDLDDNEIKYVEKYFKGFNVFDFECVELDIINKFLMDEISEDLAIKYFQSTIFIRFAILKIDAINRSYKSKNYQIENINLNLIDVYILSFFLDRMRIHITKSTSFSVYRNIGVKQYKNSCSDLFNNFMKKSFTECINKLVTTEDYNKFIEMVIDLSYKTLERIKKSYKYSFIEIEFETSLERILYLVKNNYCFDERVNSKKLKRLSVSMNI